MKRLITTLGERNSEEMGFILSHEHVFVDLRTWDTPGYAEADVDHVVRQVAPALVKAKGSGITAIVECSTVGVGRRADIVKAVSEAASFPILVPTGVYREPWIPRWVHDAEEQELKEWMEGELNGDIEGSGVRAGWIKLSAGDEGLTECEKKVLRAAAKAGVATNAVIGSHTIKGSVVKEQLDIIEKAGYEANRFIWIHAQAETDFEIHLEVARRGAWISYDGIGVGNEELYINLIRRMLDAGYGKRILLSQDRVGYMCGQPEGNYPQPYTYICDQFLPKLHLAGIDKNTINEIMTVNPFNAFAR
ncbi:phosphotriesterase-related protein [Caldicoprobacter guelmensis]|uniref:phosphotriesterase family protein n=1 Tax=Caldicoprobacter guelmensis TaxID=1170224 RepID=UPI001958D10C|nr:hypothetical protein [Caldicoprobacter guelmensis]MBM7582794.1 phosphotriesterase-related protein [Caldicoprobacter guelmensis]